MRSELLKHGTKNCKRNLSLSSLCLGSICIGLTLGWPESSLTYFLLTHCDTTCYDISNNGAGTIQMIMSFGRCLGALVPPCIADTYGRKSAFAIAGVSNFTFWTMLVTFRGYLEIVFGAAIGGFAAGIFVTTTALYVSEISLPQTRGVIGALSAFCAYLGVLFGSCLVFVTFSRTIALMMACIAVMFLVSLQCWMVESPYFLFLKGKTVETKLVLGALRGATTVLDVDAEYKTIELFFRAKNDPTGPNKSKNMCAIFSMSTKRRYAILVIIFLSITQMIGAYVMDDYCTNFLNMNVLPNYGRILISSLDVCSVGICLCVIEKFGRRPLLLGISIVGSSICCLILAIFTLADEGVKNHQENHETSIILPAIIVVLYYMIYSVGFAPILPLVTSEIFSTRYRTVALSLCISFMYLSSMIIQYTFEILDNKQGYNLAFAGFAIIGSFGIPFVFTFLPETQGKWLHEIQTELEDITILLS